MQGLARSARPSDLGALARLADQAFGKPEPGGEDKPTDPGLADMSRDQLAALRAALLNEDEGVPEGGDPQN